MGTAQRTRSTAWAAPLYRADPATASGAVVETNLRALRVSSSWRVCPAEWRASGKLSCRRRSLLLAADPPPSARAAEIAAALADDGVVAALAAARALHQPRLA